MYLGAMMLRTGLLILFICCFACSKQDGPKTNEIKHNNFKKLLAEKLEGLWLSESYLEDIAKSHSIYESRKYTTSLWGFQLEKENLLSESPSINGFTEHEGGYGAAIEFDSVKNTFIHSHFEDNNSSWLQGSFTMTLVDPTRLEFDFGDKNEVYTKIVGEQSALRRILFEGKFKDVLHSNTTIEFTSDGEIKGLDSLKYFELVFDFGEGINYDVSILYPSKDSAGSWATGNLFHFKANADTIKLFRIAPDWDEMDHKIGDVEHILVKY